MEKKNASILNVFALACLAYFEELGFFRCLELYFTMHILNPYAKIPEGIPNFIVLFCINEF